MYQHEAHLANIVTSYCTCLAGIMPLIFCALTRPQPRRWVAVYAFILVTGIPTVWLHSVEGNRIAGFFDVGTNILLAYVLQIAITGDYMKPRARHLYLVICTAANLLVWAYLVYEIFLPEKKPLLTFGGHGYFTVGESALILNCWFFTGLLIYYYKRLPREARPLFFVIFAMFFIGMILATAGNSHISLYILPWHAAWHILGAFGFITLWVFNHVRFCDAPHYDQQEIDA